MGSGQVKGACKSMVGKRLKQTGARWRVRNLNRMLSLCALRYSDTWEDYWRTANSSAYRTWTHPVCGIRRSTVLISPPTLCYNEPR